MLKAKPVQHACTAHSSCQPSVLLSANSWSQALPDRVGERVTGGRQLTHGPTSSNSAPPLRLPCCRQYLQRCTCPGCLGYRLPARSHGRSTSAQYQTCRPPRAMPRTPCCQPNRAPGTCTPPCMHVQHLQRMGVCATCCTRSIRTASFLACNPRMSPGTAGSQRHATHHCAAVGCARCLPCSTPSVTALHCTQLMPHMHKSPVCDTPWNCFQEFLFGQTRPHFATTSALGWSHIGNPPVCLDLCDHSG